MKVPATSADAWRSITQEQINEHHAKILNALSVSPASAEQIAGRIKLDHWQVNRRMKELEGKQLIFKNGTRVATATGRTAFVWSLTKPDEAPKIVTERAMPGKSISDFSRNLTKQYTQPNLF